MLGTSPTLKYLKNAGTTQHAPTGPSTAGAMVRRQRSAPRRVPTPPRPRGAGPQHHGGGGGGRRLPSAQTTQPYSALESPFKTQAEFNKGVEQNARSQYQPELDSLKTEEEGEKGLTATREGDSVAQYKQYMDSARQNFDQAKTALGEVASRGQQAGNAAQAALQASLSNTGVAGLSSIPSAQFMNEAAGVGNEANEQLAREQTMALGAASGAEQMPQTVLNEEQALERQRDTGELGKIKSERGKVLARVPDVIAKTRADMTKEEQAREANRLQAGIATKKFGLEKQGQQSEQQLKRQELHQRREESREANQLKTREVATSAGFEAQKLELERKKIDQAIAEAKTAGQKAAAEAQGKRWDHGLEIMAGIFKIDPKTEWIPFAGETQQEREQSLREHKTPHVVDPQHLYKALTEQGSLSAPEAFRIMSSTGNSAVEQYAAQHLKTYEAQELLNKAKQKPFKPFPHHRGK